MGVFSESVRNYSLPNMVQVRQVFDDSCIADAYSTCMFEIGKVYNKDMFSKGQTVAITIGSRGVSNILEIAKAVVDFCFSKGAFPFIVPAMGSHGGATAEGQQEILADYGITEEAVGCPIKSCMDTVVLGELDGMKIHMDKKAYEADCTIVLNRVKPHTAFRGEYESGLMKMIAIGLGKQVGAESCHSFGFGKMAEMIPKYANYVLDHANIIMGIAIIENAYKHTAEIVAMKASEIASKEPSLLKKAKMLMPRILFDDLDVLIIDRIGKNYSGDGHDPNISGRFLTPYAKGGVKCQKMVILDLSDETHGNGCGIGLGDITTTKAIQKLDFEKMRANAITNKVLASASIPIWADNDHDAICVALKTCVIGNGRRPRVVRIKNTSDINLIWISEELINDALEIPNIEIIGEPQCFSFDGEGNL